MIINKAVMRSVLLCIFPNVSNGKVDLIAYAVDKQTRNSQMQSATFHGKGNFGSI